jgi:hypothetical protein
VADGIRSGPGPTLGEGPDHYDYRDAHTPSTAVVEAVALATGRDPLELPLLQEALDTDALDALVAHSADASTRISFTYGGVDVVVDSAGSIVVWTDESR